MELRPFQKSALDALARPGHVLCVAPTGSGKSLIYERAASIPGRKTLIVTPLVALARQQRARLAASARLPVSLGAGAPSEPPPPRGRGGAWIVSPEKLLFEPKLRALREWKPDFLVVDECHCLWEWGEAFRPAFRLIPGLLKDPGIGTSLWLTATLPREARDELRSMLGGTLRELGGFGLPPALDVRVARVRLADRAEALLGWVRQQRAPGIVFAPTRDSASRLGRLIEAMGVSVIVYHAGLGSEERRIAEARVASGSARVIVATSAFGMGMDYPVLEWVALWQAPATLLSFAQAIGRVGRDPRRRARALVLWDEDDFRLLEWTLRGLPRRRQRLMEVRAFLMSTRCRRVDLVAYFDQGDLGSSIDESVPCDGLCDVCAAAKCR